MRFLLITLFSFVTISLFNACQKEVSQENGDPSGPSNPSTGTGSMKAKINSDLWTAKLAGAYRMNNMISITGVDNNKRYLTITLTDSGVHKYILSDVTMNAAALIDSTESNKIDYSTNQGEYPTESGGEVNITSIDTDKKTISGTFSFKVFREMDGAQRTVTEGSFTNLPYSSTLPPASTTDTFNVKIDNTAWKAESITGMTFNGNIVVNATNSSATKAVGFIFPSNITPGTYTFEMMGAYMGQYNPDLDPLHAKQAVSGTLTILEHNTSKKRIKGNFSFRGEEILNPANKAELKEGYFSVTYL